MEALFHFIVSFFGLVSRPEFFVECYNVGDNAYTCTGGRR